MNWLKKILRNLTQGVGELSPSCRQASRLQSEQLDHPLTFRQRVGLRIHLVLCKWCRRYGKQIGFLHDALHKNPDRLGDCQQHQLSPQARQRLKQKLEEARMEKGSDV